MFYAFQFQMCFAPQQRAIFHLSGREHSWTFRCGKSARRCDAKHMWKLKGTKHRRFGALLEVEMSKKCLLWREPHLEVKSVKNCHVRTTFGSCEVEKVHAVVARSTLFGSQNVQNTTWSDLFWTSRCRPAVEKVHGVVARSSLASKKCQKLKVLSLF